MIFSHETCSFYDLRVAITTYRLLKIDVIPSLKLGLPTFLVFRIRGTAIATVCFYRKDSMHQFRRQDIAVQVARLLAVWKRLPIIVMARSLMDWFTVAPITTVAVHVAGRHVARVSRSELVRYRGLP